MKNLETLLFYEIKSKKDYVVTTAEVNKFGEVHVNVKVGNGKEVIKLLKEVFSYGDGSNYSTISEFFDECEVVNGDEGKFVEVFELLK